jgi:type VI protein secretion system component Hcp
VLPHDGARGTLLRPSIHSETWYPLLGLLAFFGENPMASDAYMEISDPAVWGETYDQYFGMKGRAQGAFEIFGFDLQATSNRDDGSGTQNLHPLLAAYLASQPGHAGTTSRQFGATATTVATAKTSQPVVKIFTIKKYIDKASPDLLLACCKAGLPDAKKIDWAIISIRETGEGAKSRPYLVLEFRGLWVESLGWSLSPGAEATSASTEETVVFSFEQILVKYSRQQKTGAHQVVKIRGFNRKEPTHDVEEIGWNAAQQREEEGGELSQ